MLLYADQFVSCSDNTYCRLVVNASLQGSDGGEHADMRVVDPGPCLDHVSPAHASLPAGLMFSPNFKNRLFR